MHLWVAGSGQHVVGIGRRVGKAKRCEQVGLALVAPGHVKTKTQREEEERGKAAAGGGNEDDEMRGPRRVSAVPVSATADT